MRRRMMASSAVEKLTPYDYPHKPDVLWLSGEFNDGMGVHNSSATVWKDISGAGNDFQMTANGWQWQNDGIRIDGTSTTGYVGKLNKTFLSYGTIECVFSCDDIKNHGSLYMQIVIWLYNFKGVMANAYYSSGDFFCVEFTSKGGLYEGGLDVGKSDEVNGRMIACACVHSSANNTSSVANRYLYGQSVPGSTYITNNGALSDFVSIGGQSSGTRPMCGVIKEIRCHSRKLTGAEIAANYAIDKKRFGLP